MCRRFIPLALAALLQVTAAAQTTQPAPNSEKHKYIFEPAYRPGDELLLVHRTLNEQSAKDGRKATQVYLTEMRISVREAKAAGDVSLNGRVRRIRYEAELPTGEKAAVDTDRPETLAVKDRRSFHAMMAAIVSTHEQSTLRATLTEGRRLTNVKVQGKFLQQFGRMPPEAAEESGKRSCGPYEDMLAIQWAYLPTRPVAVSENWEVKRDTYAFPATVPSLPFPEQVTCTLAKVIQTKEGSVAEITIAGTLEAPAGFAPGALPSMKRTGTLTFNLDTGKVISAHLAAVGKMRGEGKDVGGMRLTTDLAFGNGAKVHPTTESAPARRPAK